MRGLNARLLPGHHHRHLFYFLVKDSHSDSGCSLWQTGEQWISKRTACRQRTIRNKLQVVYLGLSDTQRRLLMLHIAIDDTRTGRRLKQYKKYRNDAKTYHHFY